MLHPCGFFRCFGVLILSASLLFAPVAPVAARVLPDALDHKVPLPPGVPQPHKGRLPPGLPVPGVSIHVPAPHVSVSVPAPPIVVEKRRPEREREYRHHRPDRRPRPYGSVHRRLPADIFALHVAGAAFFYHMGTYYRQTRDGYVVVQAPFGARVRLLPDTCSTLVFDGRRYYDCDDVYYQEDGDEYIVIERPSHHRSRVEIGDEVRIKAESLNVRSGPGTGYRVVDKLYRGDIVEVTDIERGWYAVRLSRGRYGWIMREYTRLHKGRHDVKG